MHADLTHREGDLSGWGRTDKKDKRKVRPDKEVIKYAMV